MHHAIIVSLAFVVTGAAFVACHSMSTNDASDAGDAGDAASDDGGVTCASSAGPLTACAWDASSYPADAASGECRAGRTGLDCTYPNGVEVVGCLSDNLTDCSDPIVGHVDTGGPAVCCVNRCAPNEHAVFCTDHSPNIPVGCRDTARLGGTPAFTNTLLCCACP